MLVHKKEMYEAKAKVRDRVVGQSLEVRANSIQEICNNFIVDDEVSYAEADRKVSETAALEKGIAEYWADPKMTAHKSWKSICKKERDMLEPIQWGSKLLSRKMSDYKRIFDEKERKKWDEAQEKARNEARLEAFKLAEEGLDPVAVEAITEMAEEAVPMAPAAELRGKTTFVQSYEVRMIPGESWRIPKDILEPTTPAQIKATEAKVKSQAKLNGGIPVRGFEITSTQTARRRTI